MKLSDIPQDDDPTYSGQKKLCYAVDESGHIVQGHSSGWQTEDIVKNVAWAVINKDLELTRHRIRDGVETPLTYFMKRPTDGSATSRSKHGNAHDSDTTASPTFFLSALERQVAQSVRRLPGDPGRNSYDLSRR